MSPDLDILHFFNHTIAGPTFDPVMIALTNSTTWLPVYIAAALGLLYYQRWRGLRIILSVIVLVGTLDLITNRMLKPAIARERPCHERSDGTCEVADIRLPDGGRGGFSFPSSHAVNNFGVAVFFLSLFPRRKYLWPLLAIAFIVAITRLYLGLHYPSDTLTGMILGSAVGYWFAKLYFKVDREFFGNIHSDLYVVNKKVG